jgi:hypothetical protein
MTQDISTLTFKAAATGNDLKLTARLNGRVFFDQILTQEEILIKTEFLDTDRETYLLEIEMSGKKTEHTTVDDAGNIAEDRMIEISDFAMDDIALAQLFTEKTQYHHDFNGSQAPVVDKFFGTMGCNGVVKFEFTAPAYIWILENM